MHLWPTLIWKLYRLLGILMIECDMTYEKVARYGKCDLELQNKVI